MWTVLVFVFGGVASLTLTDTTIAGGVICELRKKRKRKRDGMEHGKLNVPTGPCSWRGSEECRADWWRLVDGGGCNKVAWLGNELEQVECLWARLISPVWLEVNMRQVTGMMGMTSSGLSGLSSRLGGH